MAELNYDLKPINPLVGILNINFYLSELNVSQSSYNANLYYNISITFDEKCSSTSISNFSIGSYFFFPLNWYTTSGGNIDISKPSLLILSISIPKCKSPLPLILIDYPSVSVTIKDTSVSASFLNLYKIDILLRIVPSSPAIGEVFTYTFILIIGGSISIDLSIFVCPIWLIVWVILDLSDKPLILTISPAYALSNSTFLVPYFFNILYIVPWSTISPF